MKRILNRYESISGQVVNLAKSVVTFLQNTNEEIRRQVCQVLGVKEASSPGKYLGLPIHIGRNRTAKFNFLVERVDQKLQDWCNQLISRAGKLMLLKTSAQSIPNFWMNLFLLPHEYVIK